VSSFATKPILTCPCIRAADDNRSAQGSKEGIVLITARPHASETTLSHSRPEAGSAYGSVDGAPRAAWTEALIADDDSLWLHQLKEMLASSGGRVRVARDGEEWTSAIRACRFDLVIVEPNLPGRLWYPLMHDVRSHAPEARLVVATAFPSRALSRVARSLGAEAVLTKPVRLERVAQLVNGPGERPDEGPLADRGSWDGSPGDTRTRSLARLEWEYINHVLRRCNGNVTEASRALRVPRQTLYRKLRKHPPAA
jgi:two-component system response regulator RegA